MYASQSNIFFLPRVNLQHYFRHIENEFYILIVIFDQLQ